ncbi:M1 family metallopeptidase [Calycomorphotria hydatis]|uniref:Peptidase MA-like domain-containing protein n=1 Tax=Calycomorphotria hydatis TaxID=2528027 RepID=A0A517TBF3_9PLAN|nr:M1 family metallopeptidase [Calycomorphotria hydatis]QDT65696.1 hypothetical protein V22_29560 [Calycomorphotria hydatis]
MEAQWMRLALLAGAVLSLGAAPSVGADYRSPNFVVTAPTADFAKQVAMTAEQWRVKLAVDWLGKELPRWASPCPIRVKVGQIGAGGATSFSFDRGEVFGWRMNVQGTAERILDSVIPHEVSHTIFATHFRRPLPRWADEGAATLAEHESEQRRQDMTLKQVWSTSRRIPLSNLLSMTEYPSDMQDVMTLYAEGYSLADFLVQLGGSAGKERYLKFLADAHRNGWDTALRENYRLPGISALESKWGSWVVAGSPEMNTDTMVASNTRPSSSRNAAADSDVTIRSQSPDEEMEVRGRNSQETMEPSRGRLLAARGSSEVLPTPAAATERSRSRGRESRPSPLDSFLSHTEIRTAASYASSAQSDEQMARTR